MSTFFIFFGRFRGAFQTIFQLLKFIKFYYIKVLKSPKSARYLFLALNARLKKCGASKGQKARISLFITRSGHTVSSTVYVCVRESGSVALGKYFLGFFFAYTFFGAFRRSEALQECG